MVDQCAHLTTKLREFTACNGAISYRMQCQDCGAATVNVKKEEVRRRWPTATIPPWDESLRDAYFAQFRAAQDAKRAEREAELAEENARWWDRYNSYLASPGWQARRSRVLERDEYRCQAGLMGCRGKASQAHHLTYDRVFHEPLFDLVAVCVTCHEQITFVDRARRERRHVG